MWSTAFKESRIQNFGILAYLQNHSSLVNTVGVKMRRMAYTYIREVEGLSASEKKLLEKKQFLLCLA